MEDDDDNVVVYIILSRTASIHCNPVSKINIHNPMITQACMNCFHMIHIENVDDDKCLCTGLLGYLYPKLSLLADEIASSCFIHLNPWDK